MGASYTTYAAGAVLIAVPVAILYGATKILRVRPDLGQY